MMLDKCISQATYYFAAISAFILTNLNEIALIVGIVCTVASTVINWYYKCREAKRNDSTK
jgi:hypothetical protein